MFLNLLSVGSHIFTFLADLRLADRLGSIFKARDFGAFTDSNAISR